MSLNISPTPGNLPSTANTPIFQDWQPANGTITDYFYTNNFPMTLTSIPVVFKIKDVIGNPDHAQFIAFRLRKIPAFPVTTSIPFVAASIFPDFPGPLSLNVRPLTENGAEYTYTPIFQNLILQTNGVKLFTVKWMIEGKLPSNDWEIVSSTEHTTRLNVVDTTVVFSPAFLNYQHTKNTTLPSRDIDINGLNWKIQVPTIFNLSSVTPGVTITTETVGSQTFAIATGTGTAIVKVTLGSWFDGVSAIAGTYNHIFKVFSNSILLNTIPATTVVESVSSFYATPVSLSFSALKGIEDSPSKLLFVFCSSAPYTVEHSPWLTLEVIGTSSSGFATDYRVKPISTANMEVGAYNGFVKFKDTVSGQDLEVNVPVKYVIEGFVSSPYENGKAAFTLDPKFFEFFTTNINSYFKIDTIIKTSNFFTDEEIEKTLTEKLPHFNKRAKLNYGLMAHRLMDKFDKPNENLEQYKPARFSMNIEEIDIETGLVLRDAFIENIFYVAGLSNGIETLPRFLEFNKLPIRVTKNSFYIMNCLVELEEYNLLITRNNIPDVAIYLGFANGHILSKKINFASFNQGDVIEVSLNAIGKPLLVVPTKTFYVIPEQRYSWQITWENEYLLQSILECLGNLTLVSDFERRSATYFKNLVEVLEYIESNKVSKLNISTGWILKTQIDDIESLMRSKRVWLTIGEKEFPLRPINKGMANLDKEKDLIEFVLEFQINRNYDQETYSF